LLLGVAGEVEVAVERQTKGHILRGFDSRRNICRC
jgi:hypothetical protein